MSQIGRIERPRAGEEATVIIPKKLYKEIEKFIKDYPTLGFKSVDEYAYLAIKGELLEDRYYVKFNSEDLEPINTYDNAALEWPEDGGPPRPRRIETEI